MDLPRSSVMTEHELYYSFSMFDRMGFVRHGISTRHGGVSEGIWHSLNLGFLRGDKRENVLENYRRFCKAVGVRAEDLVLSAQEHHTNLLNVTAADRGRGITQDRGSDIDGLLTDEPNVVLCTHFADCVPLLFVDPVRRVVAASHAGWRGTVADIGGLTVERMCTDYGCRREDIHAAIAPSIGPCCFEVDEPVAAAFRELSICDDACCREDGGGKYHVHLWEVNRRLLCQAGIPAAQIAVTDLCTKCHADTFWSHRATGGQRGSMAAIIGMCDGR